jgi:ADP-ribose pyrophosphatase YjhB (NUDIX family)
LSTIPARHACFNYRVAAVFLHDRHALLHRGLPDSFWTLPGGRPELYESSHDALIREMQEEMGLRVEIQRLLWVVENFFEYEGEQAHELAFYYLMRRPENSGLDDLNVEFTGFEGDLPIIFRWYPVELLADVPLYPTLLKTALADLPAFPVHVIHVDPPKQNGL